MKQMNIPNEALVELAEEYLGKGKTFMFRAKGYSMRPFIEDNRDLIILDAIKRPLVVGDVILARTTGHTFVIHRIVKIDGDAYTLRGDGNIATELCYLKDIKAIIKGFKRKGRDTIEYTSGTRWRAYSYVWMRTLWLRPYLLAFYRHFCLRTHKVTP